MRDYFSASELAAIEAARRAAAKLHRSGMLDAMRAAQEHTSTVGQLKAYFDSVGRLRSEFASVTRSMEIAASLNALANRNLASLRSAMPSPAILQATLAPMTQLVNVVSDIQRFVDGDTIRRILSEAEIAERALKNKRRRNAFGRAALCLAPSMADEVVRECERLYDEGEDVTGYVLAYYRKDGWKALQEMVVAWEGHPFLGPRMQGINEALWAHLHGRYTLSVRLLVTEPEGLVMDWAVAAGEMEALRKLDKERKRQLVGLEVRTDEDGFVAYSKRHLVTKVIGELPASRFTRTQWTSFETFNNFCEVLLYRQYKAFEEHEEMRASEVLARHAISHGSAMRAGSDLNSLRLFLALDVLRLLESV